MAGFQELIEFIQNGEFVNAGVANRAPRALDGNIRYLRDVLAASVKGDALIAFCQSVDSDLKVGQACYFNPDTLQYEGAVAQTDVDPLTQQLVTSVKSQVWGVVLSKVNATKADILLGGTAEVNLTEGVIGSVELGKIYYLSGVVPGKMTATRPPVGIPVMQVGQQGVDPLKYQIYVNPQFTDFLEQHTHFKFDLVAEPAGDHTTPDYNTSHVITNPDTSKEGWLPASDASFGGKAPAGAKFGYNLAASGLANVWPPTPVQSASIEIFRKSIFADMKAIHADFTYDFGTIGSHGYEEVAVPVPGARLGDNVLIAPALALPDNVVIQAFVSADDAVTVRMTNTSTGSQGTAAQTFHMSVIKGPENTTGTRMPTYGRVPETICVIDSNGIWWMTDCYNEVPWPTSFDTLNPESMSESASCPAQDTLVDEVQLTLWYTDLRFYTSNAAVLSLRGKPNSGITVYCRNTDLVKETGHLEIDLDLALLVNSGNTPGHLVFKQYDNTTKTFKRGPVAESIKSGSPEILLTSDQPAVNGKYYGNVVVTANLDLNGAEFPVETVRLDGVEEEFYEDVLGLGFATGRATEFRGRIKVPTRVTLPANTEMKLRFWVLGRIAGTLGASIFTLTYRVLKRPSEILTDRVALPLTDSALTMNSAATFDNPDEYVEMESDTFAVESGDVIQFTMSRAASDGYGDKLILLRQEGVLVAGG